MQNLKNLDRSALIDLLEKHTAHLARLLREKNRNEEYLKEKQVIKQLTAEIEARKSGVKSSKFGLADLV
jgi:hypothetical protein